MEEDELHVFFTYEWRERIERMPKIRRVKK